MKAVEAEGAAVIIGEARRCHTPLTEALTADLADGEVIAIITREPVGARGQDTRVCSLITVRHLTLLAYV